MNNTAFEMLSEINTTQILNAIPLNKECWGEYTTILLAFLFFCSEILPFIKKSSCNKVVVDEGQELERKNSVHEAQGLIHLLLTLAKKKQQFQ